MIVRFFHFCDVILSNSICISQHSSKAIYAVAHSGCSIFDLRNDISPICTVEFIDNRFEPFHGLQKFFHGFLNSWIVKQCYCVGWLWLAIAPRNTN